MFQKNELRFILIFSGILLGSVAILSVFGLIPSEFESESSGPSLLDKARDSAIHPFSANDSTNSSGVDSSANTNTSTQTGVQNAALAVLYPSRIVIASVGVDGVIKNPTSNNVNILDRELTRGAVRYPGSGTPGVGNMFIFGHSTGFSVVQNKAYKIFNTLKNVSAGDEIRIYSSGDNSNGSTNQVASSVFIYKVQSVEKVDKDEALVSFNTNGPARLTLSTCDSFGAKADRYVVEAIFDRTE